MRWKTSPSSANSMTMQSELLGSSKKASLYPATNGFLIDASILTSFKAFSFSLSVRF